MIQIQNIFQKRALYRHSKEKNSVSGVIDHPHTQDYLVSVLKYGFTLFFPLLAVWKHRLDWQYFLSAFAAMLLIAALTYFLSAEHPRLAKRISRILLLILNIQSLVLYWANSYISMQMLTNLGLTEDLSGNLWKYILSAIFMLQFSLFPICRRSSEHTAAVMSCTAGAVVLCVVLSACGFYRYSPYYGVYDLCKQAIARQKFNAMVESMSESAAAASENTPDTSAGSSDTAGGASAASYTETDGASAPVLAEAEDDSALYQKITNTNHIFYQECIEDAAKKPESLPEKPNIILVIAEGFSQQIVEDSRNITPNVRELESESICFENYYNHTFATFMALNGQFYSGYQAQNLETNYLVSLPDILNVCGYRTAFINVEPYNTDFSAYLERLGCSAVLTDKGKAEGNADSISDRDAYDLLYETALEQSEKGQPFFIAMYTFGTHVGTDSVHEQWDDGSNPLLNRFYDMDVQLGIFLKKFRSGELYDNTVFIFTADHATYQDSDFSAAFPDVKRLNPCIDRIPFLIYYKDVIPAAYDVNGRNSLDMAPTVLDFCDLSMPNYFLGKSLFAEEGNDYDCYFDSLGNHLSTENGVVRTLTEEETSFFNTTLAQYYSLNHQSGGEP